MVEGGGLENRFPVSPERGFESPSLRTFPAALTNPPYFLPDLDSNIRVLIGSRTGLPLI